MLCLCTFTNDMVAKLRVSSIRDTTNTSDFNQTVVLVKMKKREDRPFHHKKAMETFNITRSVCFYTDGMTILRQLGFLKGK